MRNPFHNEERHILLSKVLNDKNGCTIPLAVKVDEVFQVHGSATLAINRYFNIHAENLLGFARAKRESLGNQSPQEVLGLEDWDVQCLDFGTVTSARTPKERLLGSPHFESLIKLKQRNQLFLDRIKKSNNRRYQPLQNHLYPILNAISKEDDISRKVRCIAVIEAILKSVLEVAEQPQSSANEILLKYKTLIAQELGDTVRDMLGWHTPTITVESGTYLNAHLSILAGAHTSEHKGGLHFLTFETGGNAPRAAMLNQLHFGSDQAGRRVNHNTETPIYKDRRSPALVYTAALRNEYAVPFWGKGRAHKTFDEYIITELQKAIDLRKKQSFAHPFRVVVSIPDRSKTSNLVSIAELKGIADFVTELNQETYIERAYFIIDGCQSRGEAIKALNYPEGPITYFEKNGLLIDGMSWTISKGPGGSPFAAGITLRYEAYFDLRKAIEEGEKGITASDGFVAKYIKQGDFPAPIQPSDSIIEKRAIADYAHQVRLIGDLPRLWRWAEVYHRHEKRLSMAKDKLRQQISGPDKYFIPLNEASDPSVLNLFWNHEYIEAQYDLSTIAKLLRVGFELGKLSISQGQRHTNFERAAALLSTPTGQTVIEHIKAKATIPTTYDPKAVKHPPIIRFAINLELAETAAYDMDRFEHLIPILGNIINTRIRLILQYYQELSAGIDVMENARVKAEQQYYATSPKQRYYDEGVQSYVIQG